MHNYLSYADDVTDLDVNARLAHKIDPAGGGRPKTPSVPVGGTGGGPGGGIDTEGLRKALGSSNIKSSVNDTNTKLLAAEHAELTDLTPGEFNWKPFLDAAKGALGVVFS